jgi:hypothetical protein
MARPSRWTTPALGYSPRRDGTAAGASTSSGFRKCAPMPHRGQETVTRVLRLSRRRDILRRTRPTRVYPHCARHVSRSCRLSVVCTPRYDACATKVIVRGAHAGPRTLGHPPSGCGIDPRFLELHRHRDANRDRDEEVHGYWWQPAPALSADVRQFEGAKVCRGSFSSDFGTASMCAAATLLLAGSAVIAKSVFRFRSIRRSLRLASVTLAGRRVGAV